MLRYFLTTIPMANVSSPLALDAPLLGPEKMLKASTAGTNFYSPMEKPLGHLAGSVTI
jgi:hypothetical protein